MASVSSNQINSGALPKAALRELRSRLRAAASAEMVLPPSWGAMDVSIRLDKPQSRPAAPAYLRRAVLAKMIIREETPVTLTDDLLEICANWAEMTTPLPEMPAPPQRQFSTRRSAREEAHRQLVPQDDIASAENETDPTSTSKANREAGDNPAESDLAEDSRGVLPFRSPPRKFVQTRYHELRDEILASLKADDAVCLGLIDVDDDEATLQLYAGLATALSDGQEPSSPVLLIDANLADRRLSRSFASANLPGVGEHVLDQADLNNLIVPTSLHGVSLLPGGGKPPRELRDTEANAWEQLFTELKKRFKYVLIEFSAESTLPGALSAHLDAVHLCMRLNRTPRTRVSQLVRRLQRDGIKNLGCLLADLPRAA
ncbi:MAG: hypothetical protein MPJ50_03955 [Pirellulales bacterium]|nr:hypothetical protein [Pirellulales bacterium]